jgi:UDP-glucose 4-epimerase
MVLPRFVAAARQGQPLPVHGDGGQRRCFLHVKDAVDALLLLARAPAAEGRVVNVGSDEEWSVLDLARRVLEETGSRAGLVHVPFAEVYGEGFEDFRRRRPDLTLLRSLTGFAPRRSVADAVRDLAAAAPVA